MVTGSTSGATLATALTAASPRSSYSSLTLSISCTTSSQWPLSSHSSTCASLPTIKSPAGLSSMPLIFYFVPTLVFSGSEHSFLTPSSTGPSVVSQTKRNKDLLEQGTRRKWLTDWIRTRSQFSKILLCIPLYMFSNEVCLCLFSCIPLYTRNISNDHT